MVCDDEIATVGTVNWDFRSLYLHFECGTWMYKTKAVADIKADFDRTLAMSMRITEKDMHRQKWPRRMLNAIMRVFAPLL